MCTILLAYKMHPNYPFLFVGNRDEFFDRPTATAEWKNGMLAGQDLKEGGTWTMIDRNGRFAALTNFRNGFQEKGNAPSRGKLIPDFIQFEGNTGDYFEKLGQLASDYNGFNLLFGSMDELYFLSNSPHVYGHKLESGIHVVSNGMWNDNWPKMQDLKHSAENWLKSEALPIESIFEKMHDKNVYPDELLPQTGVPIEWERALSALFVQKGNYGTRTTTIITVNNNREVAFLERTHAQPPQDLIFEFNIGTKISYQE